MNNMAVPDKIELDLSTLTSGSNRDAVDHLNRLLRQILFSSEVTPSSDETGEWPQDFSWEIDSPKITLRKVAPQTHREQYAKAKRSERFTQR